MPNPKSKKRRKRIILSIIALAFACLAAVALFHKKSALISIQQEKVARHSLTELVKASGKIQPVLQVKISPEVSGEIIELPVHEGQVVHKGDLLVKIRPDNYKATRDSQLANYHMALANSNTSAANLEKARLEYKRSEALFDKRLISDSDFLTAKTSLDVAAATAAASAEQVGMAHASYQNAESDLAKSTIYAPRDGTITRLNSQLGERVVGTAMMAGTEMMTISDLSAMEARVDIGEVDVVLIRVGQKVGLEVDAFKDQKFTGFVTDIANSAKNNDTSTASAAASSSSSDATKFQVKIRLQDKQNFLPGMSVSAEIETRYRTNVLAVPIQCVTLRPPGTNSATATNLLTATTNKAATNSSNSATAASTNAVPSDDSQKAEAAKPNNVVFLVEGDHVRAVPVSLGVEDDNYWEITDGLKEGQSVVTGGTKAISKDLQDGSKIAASSNQVQTTSLK